MHHENSIRSTPQGELYITVNDLLSSKSVKRQIKSLKQSWVFQQIGARGKHGSKTTRGTRIK